MERASFRIFAEGVLLGLLKPNDLRYFCVSISLAEISCKNLLMSVDIGMFVNFVFIIFDVNVRSPYCHYRSKLRALKFGFNRTNLSLRGRAVLKAKASKSSKIFGATLVSIIVID